MIEKYAFYQCGKLKKVSFQEGSKLEEIGDSGFARTNLEEITLPRTLKEIGWDAFNNCKHLKTIYVEDGCMASLYVTDAPNFAKVGPPPGTMAGSVNVWDLRNCREVTIPESIKRIGNFWFWGTGIESVTIPASVREIDT